MAPTRSRSAMLLALAAGIFGCSVGCRSKDAPRSGTDAASQALAREAGAPDAQATGMLAVADAGSSALEEGDHDYDGTIASRTRIGMHLRRTGSAIVGSYFYATLGRPLSLEGTVDSSGALVLT